jgi:hypothetical protein
MRIYVLLLSVLLCRCVLSPEITGLYYDDINHGPWFISTGSMSFNALYFYPDSVIRLEVQGSASSSLGSSNDTLGLVDVFKWVARIHCQQGMDENNHPYPIPQKDIIYAFEYYCPARDEDKFRYTELEWRQATISPITGEETNVYDWHIGGAVLFLSQSESSLTLGYPDIGTPPGWPTEYYTYDQKESVAIKDWRDIWDVR